MRLNQPTLCIAGAIVLAGGLCAQSPSGQYPQSSPQQGRPGMGSPTYPNDPNSPNRPDMGPSDSTQSQRPADATAADKKFVKEAAEGGLAEVELGKLAQEKGSSDSVKQFGERMVQDHSKANDELKKAAAEANISVPDAMPAKDRRLKDKLSKLSGSEFDREYMKAMVSDHKTDLKAFERESQSGRIPQIKEFASNTIPTLQDHLKSAEQVAGGEMGKMSSAK